MGLDFQPFGKVAINGTGKRSREKIDKSLPVRLAAIHAFFRYVGARYPEQIEHAQRIRGVPFKRASQRAVEYLDYAEIEAILSTIDRSSRDGRRCRSVSG